MFQTKHEKSTDFFVNIHRVYFSFVDHTQHRERVEEEKEVIEVKGRFYDDTISMKINGEHANLNTHVSSCKIKLHTRNYLQSLLSASFHAISYFFSLTLPPIAIQNVK